MNPTQGWDFDFHRSLCNYVLLWHSIEKSLYYDHYRSTMSGYNTIRIPNCYEPKSVFADEKVAADLSF